MHNIFFFYNFLRMFEEGYQKTYNMIKETVYLLFHRTFRHYKKLRKFVCTELNKSKYLKNDVGKLREICLFNLSLFIALLPSALNLLLLFFFYRDGYSDDIFYCIYLPTSLFLFTNFIAYLNFYIR